MQPHSCVTGAARTADRYRQTQRGEPIRARSQTQPRKLCGASSACNFPAIVNAEHRLADAQTVRR
jgi:hypothetical protein